MCLPWSDESDRVPCLPESLDMRYGRALAPVFPVTITAWAIM